MTNSQTIPLRSRFGDEIFLSVFPNFPPVSQLIEDEGFASVFSTDGVRTPLPGMWDM